MTSVVIRRAAREHPPAVPTADIVIAAPPSAAPEKSLAASLLAAMAPVVSALGMVAFFLFNPDPRFLALMGGVTVLSLIFSVATRSVQERSKRRERRAEREMYLTHLREREETLRDIARLQRARDVRACPTSEEVLGLVLDGRRIWERRRDDDDFLTVRFATGAVPLAAPVRVDQAGGPLVRHDPELRDLASAVVERRATLEDAPVAAPLLRVGTVSIVGPPLLGRSLARALLAQTVAFHAPHDLVVALIAPSDTYTEWEWVKWLPHARQEVLAADGTVRTSRLYVASEIDDVHRLLTALIAPRVEQLRQGRGASCTAHLLLVLDDFSRHAPVARIQTLREAMSGGAELGVTTLCLSERLQDEPSQVRLRLAIAGSERVSLHEMSPGGRRVDALCPDQLSLPLASAIARALAPLRAEDASDGSVSHPGDEVVRLAGLLQLESPGLYVPMTQWRRPVRDLLRTPIGTAPGGEVTWLDLKESAHAGDGPHGLLVGAAGSGKSELLRSLITGLATIHTTDILNFVFIDFKGGAAFADFSVLPHVAGLITNLEDDESSVERLRLALDGERDRRQQLLRDAGNLVDVYAYREARQRRPDLTPMPWLVVIVDEFAELLEKYPDFIELFTTLGRVGRSLGVHLLLSTQKYDEAKLKELTAHIFYRLCLRTNTAAESQAAIGTADAFHLPSQPGSGYLRRGAGALERFRAALVSAPYLGVRRAIAGPDLVRRFELAGAAEADVSVTAIDGKRDIDVFVERVCAVATPPAPHIWLDRLPRTLTLDAVIDSASASGGLRAPLGLADRPRERLQPPLIVDMSGSSGNLAVVGAPQTGKSTLLRTLVATLALTHSPEELQVYCLDLGGGGLHSLEQLPHVAAVAGRGEDELMRRIVGSLGRLLDKRVTLFRGARLGSMAQYRDRRSAGDLSAAEHGDVFLVVDNWPLVVTDHEGLDVEITELAQNGLHYGVHVVISAPGWNALKAGLRDTMGHRIELRLNDPLDSQLGRHTAALIAPGCPGRGLLAGDRSLFQTALPRIDGCARVADLEAGVAELVRNVAEKWAADARVQRVQLLPRNITSSQIHELAGETAGVPLWVEETNLAPVDLDLFGADPHFLVFGDSQSGKTTLLGTLVSGLRMLPLAENIQIHIVDLRRGLLRLAQGPCIGSYSGTSTKAKQTMLELREEFLRRLPPPELTLEELLAKSWWRGPEHVIVVDDLDLLPPTDPPLAPITDFLAQAADVGLHIVSARRVGGIQGAGYADPFLKRLRELGTPGFVMSGDANEGPVVGTQRAAFQPPGRGFLVRRGEPARLAQAGTAD